MAASSGTIDPNIHMAMQLLAIGNQGVADNQRLAQNTLLAFQKDLFQGGQGELSAMLAGMALGNRTPVIKS